MTPLQTAAQAIIERWDSPYWKLPPTADYIKTLRDALEDEVAQVVEPVCSQCKGLGYYDEGHENDDGSMSGGNYVDCACNKKDFTQCTTVTNDCLGGCKSLSEHQNYAHPAPPAAMRLSETLAQQAKPKTMGDVQEMCIAALQRDERAELIEREVLLHALSGHIGWANTVGYAELGKSLRKAADMLEADAQQAKQVPMSEGEIYTAYITATNQTLRPQDERLAFAFARAVEAHHGIGGQP